MFLRRSSVMQLKAFTLIELLVAISIISLILSILLPSLSSARRTAQTTLCQTRLREIGAGMQYYALDNEDWIIGSPAGSGAYLEGRLVPYGPATQRWDWMGPMAKVWGIPLPEDGNLTDWVKRFNMLRGMPQFSCPMNDFLSTWYNGPQAGPGPMVSYNTIRYMLFEYSATEEPGLRYYNNSHGQKIPVNWSPRVTRMGDASRKVFAADGARYATTIFKPDYDITVQAEWGGTFSDVGPYSPWTRSWDRGGRNDGFDARVYAFRHSTAAPQPHAPANVFKLNLVFFDGHVQLMGDLEAANPWMWLPAGSKLDPADNTEVYEDVKAHYGIGGHIEINN